MPMAYIEKNQNTPEQDDKDNWDQGWGLVLVYVLNICKALGSTPVPPGKGKLLTLLNKGRLNSLAKMNTHKNDVSHQMWLVAHTYNLALES